MKPDLKKELTELVDYLLRIREQAEKVSQDAEFYWNKWTSANTRINEMDLQAVGLRATINRLENDIREARGFAWNQAEQLHDAITNCGYWRKAHDEQYRANAALRVKLADAEKAYAIMKESNDDLKKIIVKMTDEANLRDSLKAPSLEESRAAQKKIEDLEAKVATLNYLLEQADIREKSKRDKAVEMAARLDQSASSMSGVATRLRETF